MSDEALVDDSCEPSLEKEEDLNRPRSISLVDTSLVELIDGLEAQGLEALDNFRFDEDLDLFQKDDIVKQALSEGVDLKGYRDDIEVELRELEADSVNEYVTQSGKLLALKQEILSCDSILACMHELLLGFQADLDGISGEIKYLQDESLSMNVQLKNCRAAEVLLSRYVGKVIVTPELVSTICGDVNDAYLEYLIALNSKAKYVKQTEAEEGSSDREADELATLGIPPYKTRAAVEVSAHLSTLCTIASKKSHAYLLEKIAELQKPNTNVQILQNTSLLRYKYLMEFLTETDEQAAGDIREVYLQTMSRTVQSLLKAYHASLRKLELVMADRGDLIAIEEDTFRSIFTSKVDLSKKRNDAFCLGNRDKVLEKVNSPPILVHVAQAEGVKFPYEAILNTELKHLTNSVSSESIFVNELFGAKGMEILPRMYERTLAMFCEHLEAYLGNTFDAIGLLIMVKLVHVYRLIMQRRHIDVLSSFFDKLNMLLWPRFKQIFDANLHSIRNANPKRLGVVELHPNYVARRYTEFTASIITLKNGLDSLMGPGGEDMLVSNLKILSSEAVKLIQRMSKLLSRPKMQTVFQVNNYDQILSLFKERHIISEEVARFESLLGEYRDKFVEEELKERYVKLIDFVHSIEKTRKQEGGGVSDVNEQVSEDVVTIIVREFAASWKLGLEAIDQHVLSYFSSFRNGKEIRKQVFTQLFLYYARLQDIISQRWRTPPSSFRNALVSDSTILTEIKKYSRTS